jgi:hypothetical protein
LLAIQIETASLIAGANFYAALPQTRDRSLWSKSGSRHGAGCGSARDAIATQ